MPHQLNRYFNNLKAALTNPNNPRYKNYGGAGVEMDPDWLAPGGYAVMCDQLCFNPETDTGSKSIQRLDQTLGFNEDNCYLSRYTMVGVKPDKVQAYVDREIDAQNEDDFDWDAPTTTTTPKEFSTIASDGLAGVDDANPDWDEMEHLFDGFK